MKGLRPKQEKLHMSNSYVPEFRLCLFPTSIFWLGLNPNSSQFDFLLCYLTRIIMPISKGLITNSLLCLIPKVLVQCHVSGHFMTNSKGLPTLIHQRGQCTLWTPHAISSTCYISLLQCKTASHRKSKVCPAILVEGRGRNV